MLVSAMQQSDSDYTFIYILSHALFYYDLSQDTLGFPLIAQMVKNPPAMQETWV